MGIKVTWSNKRNIPVIYKNDLYINFGSDDPIKWIIIGGKIRNEKAGIVENLRVNVPVTFKYSSVPRDLRKDLDKTTSGKIQKTLKKFSNDQGYLDRKNLGNVIEELERKLSD